MGLLFDAAYYGNTESLTVESELSFTLFLPFKFETSLAFLMVNRFPRRVYNDLLLSLIYIHQSRP